MAATLWLHERRDEAISAVIVVLGVYFRKPAEDSLRAEWSPDVRNSDERAVQNRSSSVSVQLEKKPPATESIEEVMKGAKS